MSQYHFHKAFALPKHVSSRNSFLKSPRIPLRRLDLGSGWSLWEARTSMESLKRTCKRRAIQDGSGCFRTSSGVCASFTTPKREQRACKRPSSMEGAIFHGRCKTVAVVTLRGMLMANEEDSWVEASTWPAGACGLMPCAPQSDTFHAGNLPCARDRHYGCSHCAWRESSSPDKSSSNF